MVGIDVLKENVVDIALIIKKVDLALEDDKISFSEAIGLAMQLPKLFRIIKSYNDAVEELKDLDEEEVIELNEHFAKEFDLRNDKAEEMVEQILGVIVVIAASFLKSKELPE